MTSPCFNVETRTDCPDRRGGCAATCKKWAKYVEARNKDYEKRQQVGEVTDTINQLYYYNQARYLRQKAKKMNRRPKMR